MKLTEKQHLLLADVKKSYDQVWELSNEANDIHDPQFAVLAAHLHSAMKIMFSAAKESKEIERNAS